MRHRADTARSAGFNPSFGLCHIGTAAHLCRQRAVMPCFNPSFGLSHIGTCLHPGSSHRGCFNPSFGLSHIGTLARRRMRQAISSFNPSFGLSHIGTLSRSQLVGSSRIARPVASVFQSLVRVKPYRHPRRGRVQRISHCCFNPSFGLSHIGTLLTVSDCRDAIGFNPSFGLSHIGTIRHGDCVAAHAGFNPSFGLSHIGTSTGVVV